MMSLVMAFLCLVSPIAYTFAQANWEHVCEVAGDCPESFVGTRQGGLGVIENLSAFECSAYLIGATGQINDECAISLNTTTSYLSFLHQNLEVSYEYLIG